MMVICNATVPRPLFDSLGVDDQIVTHAVAFARPGKQTVNMRLKRVRALLHIEARDEPYFNGTTPRYPLIYVVAPVFVLQVISEKPHILIFPVSELSPQ